MEVVNFSYYFQGKEALRDKNLITSTPQLFPGAISSRSQTARSFLSPVRRRKIYIPLLAGAANHTKPIKRPKQKMEKNRLLFFLQTLEGDISSRT